MIDRDLPQQSRAYRFFVAFVGIGRALREHLDPLLAERFGLELRDYLILNTIHWEIRYPTEIAEHLGITKDMTSRAIQKLLQAGFIERGFDPEDSRRIRLELTRKGSSSREAIRSQLEETIEGLFGSLTPAEGDRFLQSLEAFGDVIRSTLGERHVDRPQRA